MSAATDDGPPRGSVPDYLALTFPAPPTDRPYVLVNMVASLDGRTVIEGNERGLGSAADQRLMRELRFHADMVLGGASTLRASGLSSRLSDPALEAARAAAGRPALPISATISHSGDLPLDRAFFTARDFEAVVFLSDAAPAERAEAIAATGRPVVRLPAGHEIPELLQRAHADGVRMLLVEGGATINGAFFEHDAIDELFLTLGGMLVGGDSPRTILQGTHPARAADVAPFDLVSAIPNLELNEVYLRYRRRRVPADTRD